MAKRKVEASGVVAASPEAVWAVVSDFAGRWHPDIAEMRLETDARGALIRAFRGQGDPTLYREQLTWLSQSDRRLGYAHLEGIVGAKAYDASIMVTPSANGGAHVLWTAEVEAEEPRLSQICDGTRSIFERGLAALAEAAAARARSSACAPPPQPVHLHETCVEGAPRLALTVASPKAEAAKAETLCLFLHGIGGGRDNWRSQLSAAGGLMTAASVDLRGYGGSLPGDRQTTVEDYCADILRIRSAFDARRLVLVGLSYGSWIATSFAMRHPKMLAGLVLSGGCTGMSEAGEAERAAFRASREAPLDAGATPADFAPAVVGVIAGPNASAEVRAQLLASMSAIPAGAYRDALNCFTHPPEKFDFSRLSMPVLLMTGEYDRLAPPAEIRSVAQRIHAQAPRADVRFEVVADAGHVCNLEQPEAYNRILLEFLGRPPP